MALAFEIINGEAQGKKFLIEKGIKLGRTQGNLLIPDEKASSLHAEVQLDNKNQLILVDLQSSNGLSIQGKKVKKVSLLLGVRFYIGSTEIQVVDIPDYLAGMAAARKSPEETLSEQFFNIRGENNLRPDPVEVFKRPLSLTFIEGIQLDTVYFLSFGPRICGKHHWDIGLTDYRAPLKCFKITPSEEGALIQNLSKKEVLLNNLDFETAVLKEGDIINIGYNSLRVTYV